MPLIPAGHMREEVVILRKRTPETTDPIGGNAPIWETLGQTMGRFIPMSASTQYLAGQEDIQEIGTLWIDASILQITKGMKAQLEDGRVYEINAIARFGRHLQLAVTQRKGG